MSNSTNATVYSFIPPIVSKVSKVSVPVLGGRYRTGVTRYSREGTREEAMQPDERGGTIVGGARKGCKKIGGQGNDTRWKCEHESDSWIWQADTIDIIGDGFGTSTYKNSNIRAWLGEVPCAHSARLSDSLIRCTLPSKKPLVMQSDFKRRPWVQIANQNSWNPLKPADKHEFTEHQFFKLEQRDVNRNYTLVGNSSKFTVEMTAVECMQKCRESEGCVAFSRPRSLRDDRKGECKPFKKFGAGCGKSGSNNLFVLETEFDKAIDSKCRQPADVQTEPWIAKTSGDLLVPDVGQVDITFSGYSFGAKGSKFTKALLDTDMCLKTTVMSPHTLNCTVKPVVGRSGGDQVADKFDSAHGFNRVLWKDGVTGKADKQCGSIREDGKSLRFFSQGTRVATLRPLDVRDGGIVMFYGRYCQGMMSWGQREMYVQLQYSTNDGNTWKDMANYGIPHQHNGHNSKNWLDWTRNEAKIPEDARTEKTLFRWTQRSHGGQNNAVWAIDNVKVTTNSVDRFPGVISGDVKNTMPDVTTKSKNGQLSPAAIKYIASNRFKYVDDGYVNAGRDYFSRVRGSVVGRKATATSVESGRALSMDGNFNIIASTQIKDGERIEFEAADGDEDGLKLRVKFPQYNKFLRVTAVKEVISSNGDKGPENEFTLVAEKQTGRYAIQNVRNKHFIVLGKNGGVHAYLPKALENNVEFQKELESQVKDLVDEHTEAMLDEENKALETMAKLSKNRMYYTMYMAAKKKLERAEKAVEESKAVSEAASTDAGTGEPEEEAAAVAKEKSAEDELKKEREAYFEARRNLLSKLADAKLRGDINSAKSWDNQEEQALKDFLAKSDDVNLESKLFMVRRNRYNYLITEARNRFNKYNNEKNSAQSSINYYRAHRQWSNMGNAQRNFNEANEKLKTAQPTHEHMTAVGNLLKRASKAWNDFNAAKLNTMAIEGRVGAKKAKVEAEKKKVKSAEETKDAKQEAVDEAKKELDKALENEKTDPTGFIGRMKAENVLKSARKELDKTQEALGDAESKLAEAQADLDLAMGVGEEADREMQQVWFDIEQDYAPGSPHHAFDGFGKESKSWVAERGAGAWMRVDMVSPAEVGSIRFTQRDNLDEAASSVLVEFSGGEKQKFDLQQNVLPQTLTLEEEVTARWVRVTILSTFDPKAKRCGAQEIEVRGIIMERVSEPGKGLKKCSATSFNSTYTCDLGIEAKPEDEFLNRIPHRRPGWESLGEGAGSRMQVDFRRRMILRELDFQQLVNPRTRAKQVKLDFSDGSKRVITLRQDTDLHSYKIRPAVTCDWARIEALDFYANNSIPSHGWAFNDNFQRKNDNYWKYPPVASNPHDLFRYGTAGGSMWFNGDAEDQAPVRTKWKFPSNGHGTRLKFSIDKNEACSSHFVVISPDPNYKFSWSSKSAANTIKFMWNCETKYIYVDSKDPNEHQKIKCDRKARYDIDIAVTPSGVRFTDNICGTLAMPNTMKEDFYVYVGASQDNPDVQSRFFNWKISAPGFGAKELAWVGSGV